MEPYNNSMQRTARRAAADAERHVSEARNDTDHLPHAGPDAALPALGPVHVVGGYLHWRWAAQSERGPTSQGLRPLVDKAMAEYAKARVALIDQIDQCRRTPDEMARTGRLISMFAFVDHMENCLNASRRLLASLDRLKNEQSVRGIERTDRRKIEVGGRDIREVRNTVEHMEQRIGRGDVHYGEPIALCLSEDGQAVSVAETSLRLDTLASVLRGLIQLGRGSWRSGHASKAPHDQRLQPTPVSEIVKRRG